MIHKVRPLRVDGTLSSDTLAASSHYHRMALLPQDVHVIVGSTVWAPDSLPHRHPLLVSAYTGFSLGSGLERADNNRTPSITVPAESGLSNVPCALLSLVVDLVSSFVQIPIAMGLPRLPGVLLRTSPIVGSIWAPAVWESMRLSGQRRARGRRAPSQLNTGNVVFGVTWKKLLFPHDFEQR